MPGSEREDTCKRHLCGVERRRRCQLWKIRAFDRQDATAAIVLLHIPRSASSIAGLDEPEERWAAAALRRRCPVLRLSPR
jgi:hypothetical protein